METSSSRTTEPRVVTPYYVRALVLAIPAILIGVQIPGWVGFVGIIREGHEDFRQLYTAGFMVRSGDAHRLYDYASQKRYQDTLISHEQTALPFNHLANEALLFAPLSFFGHRTAYCLFLAFNLCLLASSYRLLRPNLGTLYLVYWWLPAALFLTFIPSAAALMQGQDSLLILMLLTASFATFSRGHDLLAGLIAGLAVFKFQIVLPLGLLFLIWRRWKFVAGCAATSLAGVALSWALVGTVQMRLFLAMLLSMSVRLSTDEQLRFGIPPNRMPNLRGLLYGLGSQSISPGLLQILTLFVSLIALAAVAWIGRRERPGKMFLLAVIAATAVSYHLLVHDLSVLLLPISLILDLTILAEGRRGPDQTLFRLAVLAFVTPALIAFAASQFYLDAIPVLALLAGFAVPAGFGGLHAASAKTDAV